MGGGGGYSIHLFKEFFDDWIRIRFFLDEWIWIRFLSTIPSGSSILFRVRSVLTLPGATITLIYPENMSLIFSFISKEIIKGEIRSDPIFQGFDPDMDILVLMLNIHVFIYLFY